MANSNVTITEYAEVHLGLGGRAGQLPVEPPLAEQSMRFVKGAIDASAALESLLIPKPSTSA